MRAFALYCTVVQSSRCRASLSVESLHLYVLYSTLRYELWKLERGGGGEKRTLALLALAATYLIQIMISMIFDYGSTSTTVLYTYLYTALALYDQGELFVEQFFSLLLYRVQYHIMRYDT